MTEHPSTAPAAARRGRGLLIAAPASGSGKTTLTLGILRALARRDVPVRGAKSGPDYIDPRFHAAASGSECRNLDPWSMPPERIRALAAGPGLLVIEGAMGLFDGAPPAGRGASAELARILGVPVVLVIDAARMGHSVAALVRGFVAHDPGVRVAGVILNKVGSSRHERMLRHALAPLGIPVLGVVLRQDGLAHPARHLGLVQAEERADLELWLDEVAAIVEEAVDLAALARLAAPLPPPAEAPTLPPPAAHIALAADQAFGFAYPHLLDDWHRAGAAIRLFSPLANEPPPEADLVYLPGGYPELHAGQIAAAETFRRGMAHHVARGGAVYGECGGFMVMGDGLIDGEGHRHAMLGLLPLETSFENPRLHLGYRRLAPLAGPWTMPLAGHEFHYARTLWQKGTPLFSAADAEGRPLPPAGIARGVISGSFMHVIDRLPPDLEPPSRTSSLHQEGRAEA